MLAAMLVATVSLGSWPPIKTFYVPQAMVDGVPTYRAEQRYWNGKVWVPILEAPPIPKTQRRME